MFNMYIHISGSMKLLVCFLLLVSIVRALNFGNLDYFVDNAKESDIEGIFYSEDRRLNISAPYYADYCVALFNDGIPEGYGRSAILRFYNNYIVGYDAQEFNNSRELFDFMMEKAPMAYDVLSSLKIEITKHLVKVRPETKAFIELAGTLWIEYLLATARLKSAIMAKNMANSDEMSKEPAIRWQTVIGTAYNKIASAHNKLTPERKMEFERLTCSSALFRWAKMVEDAEPSVQDRFIFRAANAGAYLRNETCD
ncbi:hypothetical protein PFISCL1PPCAC_2898, partial [Pristionchus fissidentatus]